MRELDLEQLYVRFMFDLIGSESGGHLHFGLFRDLPRDAEHLPAAQDAYAERLIGRLPATGRILDVGCGRGGIARRLADRGLSVTAISPEADHIQELAAADPRVATRCVRFEELAPEGAFDGVLFAESFAFFAWGAEAALGARRALDRAAAHLGDHGVCVVADFVPPAAAAAIEGHPAFSSAACEDITGDVTPTIDVLEARLARQAIPFHTLARRSLAAVDSALAARVDEALAAVPNLALRALFEGRLVERERVAAARYLVYRLVKR